MSELGFIYLPDERSQENFKALEQGESLPEVMKRCVSVIDHGKPKTDEVKIFRQRALEELGYCPVNLA